MVTKPPTPKQPGSAAMSLDMNLTKTLINFRNSFNSWKRVGTIKDFPKETERLFRVLKHELPAADLDSLRCELCTDRSSFKQQLAEHEARVVQITNDSRLARFQVSLMQSRKMRNTGLTWKFNLTYGLRCKYHNTIILPIADIEQMIAPPVEELIQYKPVEKPRKSTRCHDSHPHCSICGLCHHNRRTHNNGHLRF